MRRASWTGHPLLAQAFSRLRFGAALVILALCVPGHDIAPARAQMRMAVALDARVPQPEPVLPPGIDRFDMPDLPISEDGPVIGENLRTAGPDEIVTMALADGDPDATRFEIFAQTGQHGASLRILEPLAVDHVSASVLLPEDIAAWSMYVLWPRNGEHRGRPVAINRTEGWWIGPDRAVAGQSVALYGRNLARSNGTTESFIYLQPVGGQGQWIRPNSVNPYRVEFTVPALPAGAYEAWVHNGHGGRFGWSGPFRLTITAQTQWAAQSERIVNVRQFGAKGDGTSDDSAAVEAALKAAASMAPSTVLFPAGTYAVRRSLDVPANVRWLGEDRERSVLKLVVPLSRIGGHGFLHSREAADNASFERIAIVADRQIDQWPHAMIFLQGQNIRFSHARLSSWGAQSLEISSQGLFIEDTDVVGSGTFISSSSQVFVSRSTFRMTDDGESGVAAWGGRDLAFLDNEVMNADESRSDGHGIGRLFVTQGHFGSTRNMYFSGNRTRNSAPRDCEKVDCNKGEQIIFEFGAVNLQGRATAVSSDRISFDSLDTQETAGGKDVIVVGGRGVGQRRRIIAVEGNTAILDRPWNIQPDTTTSLFFVTAIAERAVVYGNTFEGRDTHSKHDSNSTAVLVWGLCYDMVIDNNQISRMRHGLMVAATSGTAQDSVSAPFFTLVVNNRIRDGNNGIYTGLTFGFDTHPGVYGGFGNVFRRNAIASMSRFGIAFDTWDTQGGTFAASVFEHNIVRDVKFGLISGLQLIWTTGPIRPTPPSGTHLTNTILYRNVFDRGSAPVLGSVGFRTDPFQAWVNIQSRWRNFGGTQVLPQILPPVSPPGAGLEPRRTIP